MGFDWTRKHGVVYFGSMLVVLDCTGCGNAWYMDISLLIFHRMGWRREQCGVYMDGPLKHGEIQFEIIAGRFCIGQASTAMYIYTYRFVFGGF